MKRLCWSIFAMVIAAACTQAPAEQQAVNDAADALGGRDRVMAVSTLVLEGGGTDGAVGGSATPETAPNTFTVTEYRRSIDLQNNRARTEQVRTAQFAFANAVVTRQNVSVDGSVAYNIGADGMAARAADAAAATRRLELLQHPVTAVRAALDPAARVANLRTEHGEPHVDVTTAAGDSITIGFDAATNLPSHVSFPSYDANWGDIVIEAQFSEYESVSGLQLPKRIITRQDQWMTTDRQLTRTTIDGNVGDLSAPQAVREAQPPTPPPINVTVEEVGRGIWWLAGGSHHSVVFEFDDHLTIFEVPLTEARTKAVIDRARSLRPNKPLTHAIVSHHHLDHAGGFRTAVAEGLTIITHRGNEAFFKEIASRPHTRGQDALAANPKPVMFQLVDDELVLKDATNEVQLLKSNGNIHSGLLLYAWVPRDRTVVQADFFDAGWMWHPWGDNFIENLTARRLNVARHIPIHGRIQTHAEVLAVLKEKPKGP